jgi:hypothetical protein
MEARAYLNGGIVCLVVSDRAVKAEGLMPGAREVVMAATVSGQGVSGSRLAV